MASILPGKEAPPSCPESGLCDAHVHAKETDENEIDETDKKCVVADEEPSEKGQPMSQNLIVTNLGHLNLVVSGIRVRVCVQAKVRTTVHARKG